MGNIKTLGFKAVLGIVAIVLAPMAARGEGIAMILAAAAPANVEDSGGVARSLRPMALLEGGEMIATGKGGSVTLVLFSDGREYTVSPDSRIKVTVDRLEKESGEVKVSRDRTSLALPQSFSLSSRRLMGETIREHRSNEPYFVHPPNFAHVRGGSLTFHWKMVESSESVTFTLSDPQDEEVLSKEVSGDSFEFPPQGMAELNPGDSYFAEVFESGTQRGATSKRAATEFRVLTEAAVAAVQTAELRVEELLEADPDDHAPLMELMLVYLHHRLFADAAATGERLQDALPDNPELLRLQARAWAALNLDDQAREAVQQAAALETAS